MAVSVDVNVEKRKYFPKSVDLSAEYVERNCSLSNKLFEDKMKTTKRDRRKPEMQIYRPRMSLQNKNLKIEDCSVRSDTKDSENSKYQSSLNTPLIRQLNTSNEQTDRIGNLNPDVSKTSKNAKNRRPDIQVYTPKPKLVAHLNEKKLDSKVSGSETGLRNDEVQGSSSHRKKSSPVPDVKENVKGKMQISPKEIHSKLASNKFSTKHSELNLPLRTESWADLVEDSDLSNSRSTPDKCNGYVDNTNIHTFQREEDEKNSRRLNKSSRPRSNREDTAKRHRMRRNSHKSENNPAFHRETSNESLYKELEKKQRHNSISEDSKFNSLTGSDDKERRNRDKRSPEAQTKDHSNSISVSELVEEVKNVKIQNAQQSSPLKEEWLGISQNQNHQSEIKLKSDKKKRTEVSIPPRFQRNKQNQDSHYIVSPSNYSTSPSNTGGLLKLPVDFERSNNNSEVVENTMYIPKIYQEPQVFIHKHLFDPNNPSKPEIVNIPAHLSTPHMSYANINPTYCSDSSSYVSSPIQSMGYIPPPQPPALNPQFYMRPEIPVSPVPDNFLIRDVIAPPVQCSHPDARLSAVYNRSTVGYREISPVPPEPGKKKLKPIVEKNLNDISLLDRELSSLLAKGFGDANLNALRQCRWKLQLRFENIILADPKYCAERNPEQCLWKSAFHQIIELLRKKLDNSSKDKEETKANLLSMISEGTVFYENLIEKQQETYGFNLTRFLEFDSMNMTSVPETIRIVLISTQKILIYLGDLARYKEQACQTANYGKARSWYSKAQQIAPKNGRPYHQLAILAFSTRRKLDAVYYYIRSLAASNPILSAKESLLSLFEDVKRKYEQYEKKRKQETPDELEILNEEISKRHEVWIKPDGSSNQRPAEVDKNLDSSEVKNLSDVELNKRFITSFLHVHGKLFTKVGMETFPDTLNHMLKEFYFLLQRSPLPITSSRLLQLLTINIFSVDNSSLKETGREHGGSSLLQEQALYTSMVMISMLMDRCQMLHVAHKSSPEYSNQMISDDLAQLLPCVKIWTDWMSCQKSLWPPPPSYVLEKLNVSFTKNVWLSFADLLTVLGEIDLSIPLIIHDRKEDCEPIILEEDTQFAGFVPLLGALQDPTFAVQPFDKDQARHCVRISKIQFFGDYLCGISPPCMEFNIGRKRFVSLMDQVYSTDNYERSVLHSSCDELKREENLDCNLGGKSFHDNPETNELQLLWSKKEALSKTKEQQEKYKAQVQAVLHKHQSQRPIVLRIKPRYLVPDTNCFIDHLRLFRNILASSDFHLIIPLVVINELDGLARGTRVNEHTSPEHASRVTVLSREAMHFLEEQFAQRNSHLRAITSKGSVLDTISFRSEEMGENKGTNDDLILTCCLYYCKDRAENYMPQNQEDSVTLFREVVLLTDDRNLRVKALAHHVPVRDFLSFLQWANS